eukprot:scaffold112413_cov63-Phaeocystis_antarctica.AAC.4
MNGIRWARREARTRSLAQLGMKLEARQLLRPCDIYTLLAAAGEGCCSADNVCGKLLASCCGRDGGGERWWADHC